MKSINKLFASAVAAAVVASALVSIDAAAPPPAQAVGTASSTFVDEMNSFTQAYGRSSVDNWQIDSTLPAYFEGDDARAARKSTNSAEWISWTLSNISSFSFRIYYAQSPVTSDVEVETSLDGVTWTAAALTSDAAVSTGGGWSRVNLSNAAALPLATAFVRIRLGNDERVWAPQIGRVSITYTDSTLIYDELNDFTKVDTKSAGWKIDTGQSAYFDGDDSRATRTSDTVQYVTYHVPDLLWFKAKIYFVSSFAGQLTFSTSTNGSTWTSVSPSHTTPTATSGGWLHSEFSAAVPAGANYVKVQFQNDTRGWAPQLASIKLAGGAPAPNPRVMATTLSSQDVPVAIYDVRDFGAVPNDSADATGAFQGALNAAATAGGGVVFAPAGTYEFRGRLSVPVNVTLRGDWKSPDAGGSGIGTILKPYADKGSATGTAFITTHDASTVRDLSIWYPEQTDPGNVKPFPYTVGAGNTTAYGPTLKNLTLYNPYQAFNLFLAACTYVNNVFGSPLKQGIDMDKIGDVTRFEGIKFRPKYWANSGLGTSPTEAAITTYTRANATGISIERNDWNYMYDVFLEGYSIGLHLQPSSYGIYNGHILKLRTEGGRIGIQLTKLNTNGLAVTNSTINTNGSDGVSVYAPATFTADQSIAFNNTTFSSPNGRILQLDGAGSVSFARSTFSNWSASHSALTATAGSVTVASSTFSASKPHISLAAGVASASIYGNAYTGTPTIANASTGDIKINTSSTVGASVTPALSTADPSLGTYRKPSTASLFNVKAAPYNAAGNGTTNDTAAFQAALNAAGAAGGGTVYVPAGRYNITGHLSVPAGVELRGVSDGPHHFGENPRGSVLLASESQGNANGTPFVTLAASAGVRGLSVFYPNQNYSTVSAYPATIHINGTGGYAIDVTMPDSYVGIKVTAGDYYINYARGLALSKFIHIAGVTAAGYVNNVMNTVGDWQDLNRDTNAPPRDWWMEIPSCICTSVHIDNSNNVNMFGDFSFAVAYGTRVTGTSSNLKHYGSGHDNSLRGVELLGTGTGLLFVNLQVTAPYTSDKRYLYSSSSFTGAAEFFNSQVWAAPGGVELRGSGAVTLVQWSDTPHPGATTVPIKQYAGTLTMDVSTVAQTGPQVYLDSAITTATLYGNSGLGGFTVTDNKGVPNNIWMNILR